MPRIWGWYQSKVKRLLPPHQLSLYSTSNLNVSRFCKVLITYNPTHKNCKAFHLIRQHHVCCFRDITLGFIYNSLFSTLFGIKIALNSTITTERSGATTSFRYCGVSKIKKKKNRTPTTTPAHLTGWTHFDY